MERKTQGAEGRLAQAETRHAELLVRRERRRREFNQQRSLTLQDVSRMTSVLVLPHPDREAPEVRRLRQNLEKIPGTDPLAKRILEKLNAQETEIEKHEAQLKQLQAQADQQRKDYEAYLASLTVE